MNKYNMVSLTSKKLFDDGGVPKMLKDARIAAKVTLEKIEKISLVPKKYLTALEEGRYWELPAEVFATKFFKAYCKTLGMNSDLLLEKFQNEYRTHQNWQERSAKVKQAPSQKAPSLIIGPFFLKRAGIGLLMVAFAAYIGLQINHIIQSPALVVDSPSDNLVTSKQVIDIKGNVEAESRLTINGQDIYTDKDGHFDEVIGLQPGINFINFSAKKKYSREKTLVRKVMVMSSDDSGATGRVKASGLE